MNVEIISSSIFTKVWDWAGIELATTGSAVRRASVARHVTDCATRPGNKEQEGPRALSRSPENDCYKGIGKHSSTQNPALIFYRSTVSLKPWSRRGHRAPPKGSLGVV